jgi:hypothetical protein
VIVSLKTLGVFDILELIRLRELREPHYVREANGNCAS